MRKYFLALLVCLLICARGSPLHAQQGGVLNAAATTTCAAPGNAYVVVPLAQTMGGATLTVTANASGNTISFYASSDAPASAPTNWFALNATPSNSSTAATSTTSTGSWQANVAGYTFVCMEMSTLVSGTSTVRIQPSTASARSGGGGGGSGSVSNQVTDSIPANTNGTATALNAVVCTPPTVNGQYTVGYTVTSSAAVAPTCPLVGLAPDQAAGATVLYGDNNNVQYNPASAVALPTPTSLGNTNFFTNYFIHATVPTITPVTWTISLNGGTPGATAAPKAYTKCSQVIDQIASTQWDLDCTDLSGYLNGVQLSALGSGILFNTTSTGVPSIATQAQFTAAMAAQYKTMTCEGGYGDGLNAITAGTYLQTTCYNGSGATVTITGVKCYEDAGSSTMNAAGNTLGALLTGAVSCSSSFASGTQSANVLLTSGDYIKFTFVADGTTKQADFVILGTY